jgi:NAD(P) transhydrogenase subunit beta
MLPAEAKVACDSVLEKDLINEDFPETDVYIVIGADGIANPAAQDDPTRPIAGMLVQLALRARR